MTFKLPKSPAPVFERKREDVGAWEAITQADVVRALGYKGLKQVNSGETIKSQWGTPYRRMDSA